MNKGTILIGSPICQDPLILHAFFRSLEKLVIPDYEVHYFFADDCHDADSRRLIEDFRRRHAHVTVERLEEDHPTAYQNHSWTQAAIWKVAAYKDLMLDYARTCGFDHLFLVDSDILLHPQTITALLAAEKEIIAEVFWTKWAENSIPQPQVWVSDFYNQYEAVPGEHLSAEETATRTRLFFNMLRIPGVYEVGGLGACTLISRSAMEKGISFRRIKNLTFWGEDRHFCVRAAALGIRLYADTHHPPYHVYRPADLPGGLVFLGEI